VPGNLQLKLGLRNRSIWIPYTKPTGCAMNAYTSNPSLAEVNQRSGTIEMSEGSPSLYSPEHPDRVEGHHDVPKRDFKQATVKNILKRHHITKWRAAKRPKLTPEIARQRLSFAQKHLKWRRKWKRVIVSDEASVERGTSKKQAWAFRTPQEKWLLKTLLHTLRVKIYLRWYLPASQYN
jgi:hypothetical protein